MSDILTDGSDGALAPGARNAIEVCLDLGDEDRLFILSDHLSTEIGEALLDAARSTGAVVELAPIERYGERPFTGLPDRLARALRDFAPTVTILATTALPGELQFRLPLARLLRHELAVRHAHMIGITQEMMVGAMRADYHRVASLTRAVAARMSVARTARVTSEDGGALEVRFDNDNRRWALFPGLIHQPRDWGNLPEGETFTSPVGVEGTFNARLIGARFVERLGVLEQPIQFRIERGELIGVEHASRALANEVWEFLGAVENGRRVGEFGIGTNEAVDRLYGNLLSDEKLPGVHIAFGDPLGDVTGAAWRSAIHVDAVATGSSLEVDGELLVEGGRFLL